MSLISMRQLLDHAAENTYGVPVEQICEGIKNGVRKINIDTDLRLASTGIIRQFLAKNPTAFASYCKKHLNNFLVVIELVSGK